MRKTSGRLPSAVARVPARALPSRVRVGIPLGIVVLFAFVLARAFPRACEAVYARAIYPVVARSLGEATALVPFSLTELSFALAGAILFVSPVCGAAYELRARRGAMRALVRAAIRLLGEAGWIWAAFLALWGFNYARPDAAELFELGPRVSRESAVTISEYAAERCNVLRSQLAEDERGVSIPTLDDAALRSEIEISQRRALERHGLPALAGGRVKTLLTGFALRWGSSGVYGPFSAEPNVVAGLPPSDAPFVIAHERAHYSGFADEDAASFVALLSLWTSPDPGLRYSAWLALSSRLGAPEESRAPGVRRDLAAASRFYRARRGGEAPAVARVYDAFLETHGVRGGIESYGRMSDLALRQLDRQLPEPLAEELTTPDM